MIHVGTTHYRDDRWIDLQLHYLERNTGEHYRTYASLDGVSADRASRFDVALEHTGVGGGMDAGARIEHKLDLLTARMTAEAATEDPIVIVHGDTLPLPGWAPAVRRMIAEEGFAGIRRDEIGEPIPHWSFCATTARLWESLDTDWSRGPRSWAFAGHWVTDTGASLLCALEREGVPWRPILRSNRVNLHPLWFGIYGDILYHHGAGFRPPMSKLDAADYARLPIGLRNLVGVRTRLANARISRRLYRRAHVDDDFYLELMGRDRH